MSSEPETMAAALAAYMSKDETYTTQKSVNLTSILASNPNNANIIQASSIGRLALSKNACRFELPMDMKQLESKFWLESKILFPIQLTD